MDLIRSADPAPGAHTRFRDKRLKVLRASVVDPADVDAGLAVGLERGQPPGTVVAAPRDGALVACGDGLIRLEVVQPEGKGRIEGPAFVNGYQPEVGERLGDATPEAGR